MKISRKIFSEVKSVEITMEEIEEARIRGEIIDAANNIMELEEELREAETGEKIKEAKEKLKIAKTEFLNVQKIKLAFAYSEDEAVNDCFAEFKKNSTKKLNQ